jgi:hypothetical protein
VDAQVINLSPSGNNLYNTGVGSNDVTPISGDPTGANNPTDSHYTETYYIDGTAVSAAPPATYTPGFYGTPTTTGQAFVANPAASSVFPGESWVPLVDSTFPVTNGSSQWITYQANMGTASSTSGTVFQTPNTAVSVYQLLLSNIPVGDLVTLGGAVASDDNVTIYGNGKELFSNYSVNDNGTNNQTKYDQFTTLTGLTFQSGTSNTLDFVVVNNGGFPTGLNVQLTGTYYAAVPEPSTYAMLLGGLGLLVFLRARTRRQRV